MTLPGFWDNRESAQRDMERVSALKAKLGPLAQLEARVGDLELLKEMALEEIDITSLQKEINQIEAELTEVRSRMARYLKELGVNV